MSSLIQGLYTAGVVELVDTLDLGSSAVRCVGSSPSTRTIYQINMSLGCVCAELEERIEERTV